MVVFADKDALWRRRSVLDLAVRFVSPATTDVGYGDIRLLEVPNGTAPAFGSPDPRNATSVIQALTQAAEAGLDGEFDGLVTGPVHKAAINDGGIVFTGTTGLLAAQAGCDVVMMLANPSMRVALQTVHLPLREVAEAIRRSHAAQPGIVDAARMQSDSVTTIACSLQTHEARRPFGARNRHHRTRLEPAKRGLTGRPPPADTAFCRKLRGFVRCWRCTTTKDCRATHADFDNA